MYELCVDDKTVLSLLPKALKSINKHQIKNKQRNGDEINIKYLKRSVFA